MLTPKKKIMQNQVHWRNEYLNPSSKKEKPYPVVNFFFLLFSSCFIFDSYAFFHRLPMIFLFIYLFNGFICLRSFRKRFCFLSFSHHFLSFVAVHFLHFSFLVAHSYSVFLRHASYDIHLILMQRNATQLIRTAEMV